MSVFDYKEPRIEPKPYKNPVCPVCGEECETLYQRHTMRSSEIVGCDNCLDTLDAWEEMK